MSQIPISNIVNVSISLQARAITQVGFGIPLIVGRNGTFNSERIREYFSIEDVLVDFASSSDEYKAANAIFSQSPQVSSLKIAVEASRVAQAQTITFSANLITGNTISGKVDGVSISVPFNTNNSTTLTDLATALAAQPGISGAVSDGTHTITFTAQNAGVPVVLSGFAVTGGLSQATIAIATTTPNHGIAEDLTEISNKDDEWYSVIWTERNLSQVMQAASAIESRKKIFVTCSDDTSCLVASSTTDLAYFLKSKGYNRTLGIYSSDMTQFSDAAWVGAMLPYDPGSATWKFKSLAGISADNLTPSQYTGATSKNFNVYVTVAGNKMTAEGTTSSGIFADLIVGVDWLQSQIETGLFGRLIDLPKIPFTDDGIAIVESVIRAKLEIGESKDVIAKDPKYSISAPKAVNTDINDRKNRILRDVKFTARGAGAMHKIIISGVVTI